MRYIILFNILTFARNFDPVVFSKMRLIHFYAVLVSII